MEVEVREVGEFRSLLKGSGPPSKPFIHHPSLHSLYRRTFYGKWSSCSHLRSNFGRVGSGFVPTCNPRYDGQVGRVTVDHS